MDLYNSFYPISVSDTDYEQGFKVQEIVTDYNPTLFRC